MRITAPFVFTLLAALAGTASAQVYRCKDAAGKTVFTDSPCSVAQTGELVQAAKSREEILEDKLRAAEAREREANARAARAEREPNGNDAREQNVNITVRNNTPDKSKSTECANAKRELDAISGIQTGNQNVKNSRMQAAAFNVNTSCR